MAGKGPRSSRSLRGAQPAIEEEDSTAYARGSCGGRPTSYGDLGEAATMRQGRGCMSGPDKDGVRGARRRCWTSSRRRNRAPWGKAEGVVSPVRGTLEALFATRSRRRREATASSSSTCGHGAV